MNSTSAITIRDARPADVDKLREILAAAKGHWGYERYRLEQWVAGYDFDEHLTRHEAFVAEHGGAIIAWASLIPPTEGVAVLDDLWVSPAWMGKRTGSALFHHCASRAAELGATMMEWEAEPNAIGFYERIGGRYVRDETSAWGRTLRIMAVDVE